MIAIAIACQPQLIIADEPTTVVDVTIQAQLLELIRNITKELNTSLILITHNLGIVARYAQRVFVMYAGNMSSTVKPLMFIMLPIILILPVYLGPSPALMNHGKPAYSRLRDNLPTSLRCRSAVLFRVAYSVPNV